MPTKATKTAAVKKTATVTKRKPRVRKDNARAAVVSLGDIMNQSRTATKKPLTNPYRQHPTVHKCISILSQNGAQVPFIIYTRDRERGRQEDALSMRMRMRSLMYRRIVRGDLRRSTKDFMRSEGYKEVTTGPLSELFDRPNPVQSGVQFWEMVLTHLTYSGECDVINLDRENPTQIPSELWPLAPSFFTPSPMNAAVPTAWKYTPSNTAVGKGGILQPFQLIRPRLCNPESFTRGQSPLEVAEMGLQMDWAARLYNGAFFNNDASAGGYFLTDRPMTEPQREEWIREWNREHRGGANAFTWSLLHNVKEVVFAGATPKDVQFPTLAKMNKEEVAMLYGIPMVLLANTETIPNAKDKAERRGFWMTTMIPLINHLEDVFWSELFQWVEGGRYWGVFDLSAVDALQEDVNEKLTQAKQFFDMRVPFNMINERLELGFPPVPGGDVVLVPAGMMPVEMAGLFTSTPQPSSPPAEGGQHAHAHAHEETETRLLRPDKFKYLVGDWTNKFHDKYRTYLFNYRKALLKRLDYVFSHRADCGDIADYIVANQEEWDALLASTTRGVYFDAADAAMKLTAKELGASPFEVGTSPETMKAMEERILRIKGTNTTLRESLRTQMMDALQGGTSIGEFQGVVKDVLNFQSYRALTIARTEMAGIMGDARFTQMEEAGVERVAWSTAGASAVPPPRPEHLAAEQMGPVPYGTVFGATGCRYPGDSNGPADQVINCRCVLVPVVQRIWTGGGFARVQDPF